MAEENIMLQVGINVDDVQKGLSAAIKSVADLQKRQKDLTREIIEGKDADGEMAKELANVSKELEKNQRAVKSQTAVLKAATTANLQGNESLDEQRQYLGQLQKAYANLSDEQRFIADQQGGLRDQIKDLNDAIYEQEHAIGENGRNVGNYTESINKSRIGMGSFKDALDQSGLGISGLTSKFKMFFSFGWLALITLLVNAFQKLSAAFKGSEDRTNELNKALAPLKGLSDMVAQAFDKMAEHISEFVTKALKLATDAVKWLAGAIDKIAAKFGKDLGLSEAFEAAAENSEKATTANEKYIKHKRELVEKEAKMNRDLAALRADAEDKERFSAEQRLEMVKKINAQEMALAAEKKQLAKEYLEMLELEGNRSENDQAANDALAAARADVMKAETDYLNKKKELTAKEIGIKNEMAAADAAAAKAAEDAAKAKQKAEEDAAKAAEKAEEERLNAIKAAREKLGLDPEKSPEEQELEYLQQAREQDLVNDEEYELAKTMINKKYADERTKKTEEEVQKATDLYKTSVKSASTATSAAMQTMSQLLGEYAENSEEAAKAQKAFAVGAVLLNEAMSLAEGAKAIAAAQAGAAEAAAAGGPAAPILMAAYTAQMVGQAIAMVTSVATTIAQAKGILDQAGNFASGGVIGGYTSSPSKTDNTYAHVGTGEMILNASQQKRLFDIANGGQSGAFEQMTAAMTAAVAAMPAPTMAYEEFKTFESNVSTYNELSKI